VSIILNIFNVKILFILITGHYTKFYFIWMMT